MDIGHQGALRAGIEQILEELNRGDDRLQRFLEAQKLANIGNIAAGLAHNLNNILGGILGYAQLLQDELPGEPPAAKHAAVIEKACRRAHKLLSNLLFLTDLKSGERHAIDPKQLVENHVLNLLAASLSKNIEVRVRFSHEGKRIVGDPMLLTQALLNIALNAREAMPHDGILTFETELTYVEEEAQEHGALYEARPYMVLTVADTGAGMTPECLAKACQPFFTKKDSPHHSGLGLTLAEAIVREHGGKLTIDSKEGEGTRTSLCLPAADDSIKVIDAEDREQTPTGRGETIMVVDDEEDLREMAKRIFEKKGFRVLLAADGDAAIRLLKKHRDTVNLIILDLILPGKDGTHVYRKLRERSKDAKIILTSGYTRDVAIQNLIENEAEAFIPKPWEIPALLKETCRVLDSP